MADTPIPISDISDPEVIRVKLLASGKDVHAPMSAFAAASVHGAPTKTTPVDADEFGYWDSVGLQAVKTTWANLKATLKTYFDTLYQPLAATLTSWAAITRAAGFDTFVATPSSANLRTLLTDETGTGAAVFAGAPTITGIPVFTGLPLLTGGGLTFPATQVPSAGANDLDDYEEGSFTPAFSASGATFSYAGQFGFYRKIGSVVTVWVDITLNTSGNTLTANALTITGLPFTASASNGQGIFTVRFTAATTSYIDLYIRIPGSGTTVVIEGTTAAATTNVGASTVANAALHATNGSTFRFVASYFV